MIFVKSFLAGVTTLLITALTLYALAVGVPRISELVPPRISGTSSYIVGPFPMWTLIVGALIIFLAGFYWNFRRAQR